MDHVLAGSGIRLTYLQDHRAIARIEWPTVLDDLTDAGALPNRRLWCDLEGLTHVVLAMNRAAGRYVGLLGLIERATPLEAWLQIEAAMARPGEGEATLLRAMTAHMLARITSLDGKPVALAVSRSGEAMRTTLRDIALNISTATAHPPAKGNVIALQTARLAQRMGAPGLVLDLRPVAEASLLRDLRGMHRISVERVRPKAKAKPARSAAATRHPKTATRTGRIG